MASPRNTYGIARLDVSSAGTHGWQVRLQRRGVKYAKYFSDRQFLGVRDAFDEALRWRDRVLRKLEEDDGIRICRRSPRNRSGVVGVSKVRVVAANGAEYEFWQATWSPAVGKRRCVKFSVMRYGEEEAFRLAVVARTEATGR
ncbi:MAG: AP2 domain-containing protein [Verrucomicrobia bacterium]|nr:AP2 domain-containing protein [Verrucomicrobiota bacterium]MDA1007269.1 AP2 domain-containing protein [Verrucomicrobiota bacterium]